MGALRELLASFSFDFDQSSLKKVDAGLEATIGNIKNFAGALGAGLGLGAIFEFVNGLTEEADALQKHASAIGVSLAEMQEWNYAAMMQNVSAEALSKTLGRLSAGKYDPKALAELGIAAKDSAGHMKTGTELLGDVADGLTKIEDPSKRNALAMKVLGKSYLELMPLLQEGSKGIEQLRQEFESLGGGYTEDFAKEADAFGDNIDRLKTVWKNFTIVVVERVLPTLVMLSGKFFQLAPRIVELIKHTKLLEAGAIALAAKGLFFLSGKIGPLGTALKLLTRQFLGVVAPLLILEDLLVFMAGGDSLFGRFLENAFGKGTSDTVRAWVNDVKKELLGLINDIRTNPKKVEDDWTVLRTALNKDLSPPWLKKLSAVSEAIARWMNPIGLVQTAFRALGTTVSEVFQSNITKRVAAVGAELGTWLNPVELMMRAWRAFGDLIIMVGHSVVDTWRAAFDGIISLFEALFDRMRAPLRLAAKVALSTGAKGFAADLAAAADFRFAPQAPAGGAAAALGGDVTNHVEVNVNVPPGTSADLARRVGKAAADGTQDGLDLNAAYSATVNGGR